MTARLRARLNKLARVTYAAPGLGVFDAESRADEMRVGEDVKSGRVSLGLAHDEAREGLRALDADDIAQAEEHRFRSEEMIIGVFETMISARATNAKALAKPAGKRGRPRKMT